jgi:tryptophan-rich sensory protein
MNINSQDIILVILPAIIGYGSQLICSIGKNAGSNVKFRPPPWVFGVVWPILYLLLGISWAIAARNCVNKVMCMSIYSLLSILLGLWIIVYGCIKSKKGASWVLLLVLASVFGCFTQGNEVSKVIITPLLAWIIFALIMNTTEVQEK